MKNFIKTLLLSSFFCQFSTFAEKAVVIDLNNKKPLTLEDLEHENKGCPENSDCSPKMGQQRKRWIDFMKTYQNTPNKNNLIADLENFRKSYGIPIDFYTTQAAHDRFSPILFESHCSQHNPKKDKNKDKEKDKESEKILVASVFMHNSKNNQVHLTVMDTKYDIPMGELAYLDPLYIISSIKDKSKTTLYWIPKGEKPLYVDGNSVVFLRDHEGLYYGLKISSDGTWEIIEIKANLHYDDKIVDETCPKNVELTKYKSTLEFKKYYLDQFCQSIYDIQSKTQKTMALFWSCT